MGVPLEAGELMQQAGSTAREYMRAAVRAIDEDFGAGYAAQHPGLVAAFMNAAASDFSAMWTAQELRAALRGIEITLEEQLGR